MAELTLAHQRAPGEATMPTKLSYGIALRIGLPSTFTDDAKRDGNHSRACEEVWSANR